MRAAIRLRSPVPDPHPVLEAPPPAQASRPVPETRSLAQAPATRGAVRSISEGFRARSTRALGFRPYSAPALMATPHWRSAPRESSERRPERGWTRGILKGATKEPAIAQATQPTGDGLPVRSGRNLPRAPFPVEPTPPKFRAGEGCRRPKDL